MGEREVCWQAPAFEADDEKKLGFCRQAIESGIKWNQDQSSNEDLQKAIDILAGIDRADDFRLVDVSRGRGLDEDAVDSRVIV